MSKAERRKKFLLDHQGHGGTRETWTRGMSCHCGDVEYPGNGPHGAAIKKPSWRRR